MENNNTTFCTDAYAPHDTPSALALYQADLPRNMLHYNYRTLVEKFPFLPTSSSLYGALGSDAQSVGLTTTGPILTSPLTPSNDVSTLGHPTFETAAQGANTIFPHPSVQYQTTSENPSLQLESKPQKNLESNGGKESPCSTHQQILDEEQAKATNWRQLDVGHAHTRKRKRSGRLGRPPKSVVRSAEDSKPQVEPVKPTGSLNSPLGTAELEVLEASPKLKAVSMEERSVCTVSSFAVGKRRQGRPRKVRKVVDVGNASSVPDKRLGGSLWQGRLRNHKRTHGRLSASL